MRVTTLALCIALIGCIGPLVTTAQDIAPARWGSCSLELVDEAGRVLPTFSHRNRTYVLGELGRRYFVRVRNHSGRRVEVVVSVDGRDVVDGAPAEWGKRGYLVDAYGTITIDGYRLSQDAVAAFRFSSVPRSYAALEGDPRDVGVIGVAAFREREILRPRPTEPKLRSGAAPAPPAQAGASDAAPSSARSLGGAEASRRPGLGTEFGEEHASHVQLVPFERASPRPDVVLTVRYDDRAGLLAAGVDVDRRRPDEVELRRTADPFRRNVGYARPPPGWSGAASGS
jgi:hypothetical protein